MSERITSQEARILDTVSREEIISTLQTLIQKRSDFPPGDTRAAIDAVAELLDVEGIEYDIYAREDHQPSLIATYPPHTPGKNLVYHAHIDTIPPGDREDWSVDPFGGELVDGSIYGRGAGDDKGSVAAQLMALIALVRSDLPLTGNLQLAVVADEESGGLVGTRWLREKGYLAPDSLVVGEQTNNQVAIAERVACGIDLTVYGEQAHGAMAWAGDNAIRKMARVIVWLEENVIQPLADRKQPYLPPPTLNIGTIEGGIQWNVVPARCKIKMDRRLLPGETRDQAMADIRSALDEYSTTIEPLEYELFTAGDVAPNINTPPNDPFVQEADQALRDVCGEERALTGYVQTSDGRWFADDGIPIIIFGPSDPRVGHSPDEHVAVQQLLEATHFLTLLAVRQLGKD